MSDYEIEVLHHNEVTERAKAEQAEVIAKAVGGITPEAKKRKDTPMYSGLLKYFPRALAEVSRCSLAGHRQHATGDEPMQWYKDRSMDHEDALVRHLADHSLDPEDKDGILHLSKVAWRALAALEVYLGDTSNE